MAILFKILSCNRHLYIIGNGDTWGSFVQFAESSICIILLSFTCFIRYCVVSLCVIARPAYIIIVGTEWDFSYFVTWVWIISYDFYDIIRCVWYYKILAGYVGSFTYGLMWTIVRLVPLTRADITRSHFMKYWSNIKLEHTLLLDAILLNHTIMHPTQVPWDMSLKRSSFKLGINMRKWMPVECNFNAGIYDIGARPLCYYNTHLQEYTMVRGHGMNAVLCKGRLFHVQYIL